MSSINDDSLPSPKEEEKGGRQAGNSSCSAVVSGGGVGNDARLKQGTGDRVQRVSSSFGRMVYQPQFLVRNQQKLPPAVYITSPKVILSLYSPATYSCLLQHIFYMVSEYSFKDYVCCSLQLFQYR